MDRQEYVEMVESWVNGNRGHVAEQLAGLKPSQVLTFVCVLLDEYGSYSGELPAMQRRVEQFDTPK